MGFRPQNDLKWLNKPKKSKTIETTKKIPFSIKIPWKFPKSSEISHFSTEIRHFQTSCSPYCESSPCTNGGTCQPSDCGWFCDCAPPYAGEICEELLDYCQTDPCGISRCPETKCVAATTDPFFECVCECCQTGVYCLQQVDECASNPCQNSGTCVDGGCGFTCVCTQPWTGDTCETDIDECGFTPCSNEADCTEWF